jgi:glycosyltransferase involved in cell wall biosynthesis
VGQTCTDNIRDSRISMTDLSIILAAKDRPIALRNALQSWSNLDCDSYEFIVVDDGSKDEDNFFEVVFNFGMDGLIQNLHHICIQSDKYRLPNVAWNTGLEASKGDFVIFAMGDIIISSKDIWKQIQSCYEGNRVSLLTYFLSSKTTELLARIEWENNPRIIETSPDFWDWTSEEGEDNRYRVQHSKHIVERTAYVFGNERKRWEWFGGLRNTDDSQLLTDNDLFYREQCLGIPAIPIPNVVGYHQWHQKLFKSSGYGYTYKTEAQARLLKEAEKI